MILIVSVMLSAFETCQLLSFFSAPLLSGAEKCDGPLCYDFTDADKFLNLETTRKALGVGKRQWEGCNYDVYADMHGDWLKDFVHVFPEMMKDGIRVMVYAGENDLICNWLGNYR
jgi:serine carboxypeptidase-like clade 4